MNELRPDLVAMTPEEIAEALAPIGAAPYRARQIYAWIARGVRDFDEMTDLSKSFRATLKEHFSLEKMRDVERLVSRIDGTRKYLFTLSDGEYVESVLLSYHHGFSVCLSTQVGCKMGCAFCASTKAGFLRNLSTSEILNQMAAITRDMRREMPDFRISHVVLMGIGEPLDNYDNVLSFLRLVNRPDGFGISYRNISLSTCGVVPGIEKLASEGLPITLSVSLHASNSADRSALMPINKKYPLPLLLDACRRYTKTTGRRISYEYALIAGVNDTPHNARELIALFAGTLSHVNLIPVNPVKETTFSPGSKKSLDAFRLALEKGGINVTVRRTLGADIAAACGQLRREKKQSHS